MKLRKLAVPSAMALLVLALTTVSVSCGGGSSADTSQFVGNWTFDSGTLSGTCLNMNLSTDLTGGTFTLTKGTSSDLLLTYNNCQITFKVAGSTATASPANQMCAFNVPAIGMMVTVDISSWTLTTTDGTSLAGSMMGTAVADCPVMGTATASKSSGQDGSTGS